MEDTRQPKQFLDYRPIGKRTGQLLQRLLDGYTLVAEIGHLLA